LPSIPERVTPRRADREWPGWVWCESECGGSGWTPERYLVRHGAEAIALKEYDARELMARGGEVLTLGQEEAGWYWVTNDAGQSGWMPDSHVEFVG
jgi:hypothetical protein